MQNPIYSTLKERMQLKRLDAQWRKAKKSGLIDPRIPHPSINYNTGVSAGLTEYFKAFGSDACLKQLPELMRLAKYKDFKKDFCFFDYGCGLGRTAYAFTELFGTSASHIYIGYEVHPEACNFLKKAYRPYGNVHFIMNSLDPSESYVELQERDLGKEHEKLKQ